MLPPTPPIEVKHSLFQWIILRVQDEETNDEEIKLIERQVQEIVNQNKPINRLYIAKEEAIEIFRKQGQLIRF